jgi:hypothetical protein
MAVPCFTITINGKAYLWETESARQQDDFLITTVRSYRQYQNGDQPRLIGFQVGEIPGAQPAYEIPMQPRGMATPSSSSRSGGGGNSIPGPPRPTTAQSFMSNGSSRYEGVAPHVQVPPPMPPSASGPSGFTDPSMHAPSGNVPPSAGRARIPSLGSGLEPPRRDSPPQPQMFFSSSSSVSNLRKQGSSGNLSGQVTPTSSRPPLPIPQAASPNLPQGPLIPSSSSGNFSAIRQPLPPSRSATPTRQQLVIPPTQVSPRKGSQASTVRSMADKPPSSAISIDESTAAAKAAALLGQDSTLEDDGDVMLTNVEEMLEGLEWGAVAHGHSADQLEKRLLGELNALEAAGIHAIIESDDRVNDVVRYLDNALADLDKLDQMISLYKTHLNVRKLLTMSLLVKMLTNLYIAGRL